MAFGEFFVTAGGGEERFRVEIGGEGKRQAEGGEFIAHALRFRGGESGFVLRNFQRGGQADAHRFAVQEASVTGGILDGVRHGVSEIEQGACAGLFAFVLRHDGGFDRDVAGDERTEGLARGIGVEFIKHGGIADGGVFDHLGEAFAVFTVGQGAERVGVGQHEARLVEGADEIFAGAGIHAGFAADRAVDLRHDRGRDLHERDAALVNGRDKPGEIANHAAAEGDNKG